MKKIMACFLSIVLSLILVFPSYHAAFGLEDNKPKVVSQGVIKITEIKQVLAGLDKEYAPGKLIKIKISPLPTSSNVITAIYRITLLENGKVSQDCEVLTKSARSNDPPKTASDFIFTAQCGAKIKYQVLFAVTYIETKPGTAEIIDTFSPDIALYDVKISGQPDIVPDPDNPDIPPGNYGMIRLTYLECQKLTLDKATKIKLFTNMRNTFSGMSSKIAAGIYKDSNNDEDQAANVNKFLNDAKEANNKAFEDSGVPKTTFDGNIDIAVKTKMEELFNSGKLRKFSEYQALWAEISQGFDLAVKGLQ